MIRVVLLKRHDEDVRSVRAHVDGRLSNAGRVATGVPSCLVRRLFLGAVSNFPLHHFALGRGLRQRSRSEEKQSLPACLGRITAVFDPDIHLTFDDGVVDVAVDVADDAVLARLRTVVLLGVWKTESGQYFPNG